MTRRSDDDGGEFPHWYDRNGRRISQEEAGPLLADGDARRVAVTRVGAWLVSTVHMVLDQSLGTAGPPMIFETMIFPDCEYVERTPTEDAALAAHDRAAAFAEQFAPAGEYRPPTIPEGFNWGPG